MGMCFSSPEAELGQMLAAPTTNVVSVKGELHQYSLPVVASQVLHAELEMSSSASSEWFICNADMLQYEEYIPAMDASAPLHHDQMYLVLPTAKLGRKLSASDMAALAVKVALALNNASNNRGRKKKATRISPLSLDPHHSATSTNHQFQYDASSFTPLDSANSYQRPDHIIIIPKAPAARRSAKYDSRRDPTFRLKLTTIHEGIVLL